MGNNELQHWGIKGMKWGVRRYQNKDGSLTPAGKKRYAEEEYKKEVDAVSARLQKESHKFYDKSEYAKIANKNKNKHPDDWDELDDWDEDADVNYNRASELNVDRARLSKDYVKGQALVGSIVSSALLAPAAGFIAGKITKKFKVKGIARAGIILGSALGVTTVTALHAAVAANKEKRETEKKYNIKSVSERVKEMNKK